MAFLLKPGHLEAATNAADLQKLMKNDLKNNIGKKGVKFIAAKNAIIGGKTINLFILTDTPVQFETILKAKHPKAYRAKGTCELEKDKATGATKVTIKTSVGQMLPDVVAKLMPLVVANDKSFVAQVQLGKSAPSTAVDLPAGGVAEWAKEDYKVAAKRTLMASRTPDGKIGSIYFDDKSRIRTTHGAGPAKESHGGLNSLQFNVDESVALKLFKREQPAQYASPQMWSFFDQWLVAKLKDVPLTRPPVWVKWLTNPNQAHDMTQGAPSDNVKLFEIFKKINGKVQSWHPSRGTGTKFETDKQTVAVLEAAIKHIDGKHLTDPRERNVEFYKFVKSRLPNSEIVKAMRDPASI